MGAVRQIDIFLFYSRHFKFKRFTHEYTTVQKKNAVGPTGQNTFSLEQLALDKNFTEQWTIRLGMLFIRWQQDTKWCKERLRELLCGRPDVRFARCWLLLLRVEYSFICHEQCDVWWRNNGATRIICIRLRIRIEISQFISRGHQLPPTHIYFQCEYGECRRCAHDCLGLSPRFVSRDAGWAWPWRSYFYGQFFS